MTSFARIGAGDVVDGREQESVQAVQAENARILGITGGPVDRVVWKDHRALPQYNVGHAQRVAKIDGILPAIPGLYLAGNFLRGRSIGDCVEMAFRAAQDLHSHILGEVI